MRDKGPESSPLAREAIAFLLRERYRLPVLSVSGPASSLEVTMEGDSRLQVSLIQGGSGHTDADTLPRLGSVREIRRLYDAPPTASREVLTDRERAVAEKLAQGLTNPEIAVGLGIRPQSVRNLVSSVMRKLGCQNRIQVALHWKEQGS